VQVKVADVAAQAALVCGFRDGNIHAELMVLPDGRVCVLEINGRLGGMYIADWHQHIWGVDLIRAELALALGQSPAPYLHIQERAMALAQICISAPFHDEDRARTRAVFFDPGQVLLGGTQAQATGSLEFWYDAPQPERLALAGPLNLGAVTVSGHNALEAFRTLVTIMQESPLYVWIDETCHTVDFSLLQHVGVFAPLHRYRIRPWSEGDRPQVKFLVACLTTHAHCDGGGEDKQHTLPVDPGTTILCAVDTFQDNKVVGMIAVHFWQRTRFASAQCAYVHDLIVLPAYRGMGIAAQLVDAAVDLAREKGCYKADLDCEERLHAYYQAHGFQVTGTCMVQYFD
jgi:GNAT superfamily N-acetyltransferase